jgi:ubiquinone/menaquinone biosynthesis C-methylase UbiE
MILDYTDPEDWWKEYSSHYDGRNWRDYRHLLAEFILHAESGPLLDVGCGHGHLLECARQFNLPASGLEGSALAMKRARDLHPFVEVEAWRAGESLPFSDSHFGGAVLNEFIDHCTLEQNKILFKELWRVLKPGAVLIVKSPSKHNRFDQDKGHVTFFSPSEFQQFVKSFSFDVMQQPFVAQPFMGQSKPGKLLVKLITKFVQPETWAARIDLVAKKATNAGDK